MPVHTCTTPGCRTRVDDPGKCPRHGRQANRQRARTTPTKRGRDWTEVNRRRAAVKAWRGEHGDWCPGYRVPAHASDDLTADHITPVALGGDPRGPLTVLCRSCNSRKGAR